ncbi:Phage major capsid protein E [Brevibacillus sp. CF112]|uniref:major capsid protein n=1 Tax=Brevibacillus TaxID=55080 RepID=UPI000271D47B|nr:major capsid protein [Brevibacillus sp. CF112]EJL45699.1 Phage major capsid protein E [Brevibacillus sp. CF112]
MAGLAQYSEYFQNPVFTETIRQVPVEAKYIGSRFLPIEETYDIDFNESVITQQADMANIVDSGAELPLTDRDPLRRVSGEIADIGQSYIVSKKELGALMDKGNEGRRKIAEKQLLGKAATVKKNIDARIEWMRWQALGNGVMSYDKDGIKFGVDFGVTFNKTAANKWDVVGATIIDDYEAWVQEYVDKNGRIPDVYVTSIKALRTVMNNADVRKAVTGLSDKIITIQELNDFLTGRQMPRFEAFDATVTYRDVNNDGVRITQRLLSDKKGIFLVEGNDIGVQLLGPTVENQMNPGIFARTFTENRPLREIVEVVAASFPKVTNPDLIGITNILA